MRQVLIETAVDNTFSNLKNITPRAAKVLSSYQGNILEFPALTSIQPRAFTYLTAFKNEFLTIGSLTKSYL
jgi:hypothetical protein